MLLLLGGGGGQLAAATALLTLTAPTAAVHGSSAVPLTASAATLTFSGPTATLTQGYAAPTATLQLSAPTPTVVSSPVTLTAATALLTLSAPSAGLDIDLTQPIITIDATDRLAYVRRSSLTITDLLDEAPNTCALVVEGFTPSVGEEIVVAQGIPTNRIFAGHLTSVEQSYESKPDNVIWNCGAVDYTRLLDRLTVHKKYPAQSATTTVNDILATFTSGFTNTHVTAGLPTLEEIEFTWEAPTMALTRIAKLLGGYWYVDYDRDIHFFITEATDAPDDITDAQLEVRGLTRADDLSQVRTRVIVEGNGSRALAEVAVGATLIPVDDSVYYSASGGLLKVGSQRLTYTGKVAGGAASTLRGIDGPVAAPTAALGTVGGGIVGAVSYKVTFKNDVGETIFGPASNTVTGVVVAPPVSAPTGSLGAAPGKLLGNYQYRTTLVTALGETTVSSAFNLGTVAAFAQPGSGSAPSVSLGSGLGNLVGAYNYKVTGVNALGETLPSSAGSRTASALAVPSAPTVAQSGSVIGGVDVGNHQWRYTWVTDKGETSQGAASSTTAVATWTPGSTTFNSAGATNSGSVPSGTYAYATAYVDGFGGVSNLGGNTGTITVASGPKAVTLNIPTGPPGTVSRRIYRYDNYSFSNPYGGTYHFVGEVQDNLTTTFTDSLQVPGAPFNGGTAGGPVTVTIGTAPTGSTHARVYRSLAGTTTPLYLVGEISVSPGSGASFVDAVPDARVGATSPPAATTAGGERHTLTIATGPTGTLARRIYRTAAGGSQYFLLGELQDNSTTTWTDDLPDDSLSGEGPPLVSTAGGAGVIGLTIAVGPTGTIARRLYRTKAGGSEYFFVTQLSDNVTTAFTDTKADDELGAGSPLANTAGASSVQVSSIPVGGAGITARRLYRTMGGGIIYFFVTEIKDNVTTSWLDTAADDALGDVAPSVSTIGAQAGDTTIRVDSTSGWPSAGWVYVGSQLVRFTGKTSSTITGVPATGAGSLESSAPTRTEIIVAGIVTGIPASGVGSIASLIRDGDDVDILVERDDLAAQAVLAALEGGDGVHEYFISDSRLSIASATARGDAELAQFSTAEQRLSFSSRDYKLRSGKTITISVGAPTDIAGTFKIQQVVISNFVPGKMPWRQVTASTYLYSLEHLLRRVELGA